jgi:putative FmdB family regulatory protein
MIGAVPIYDYRCDHCGHAFSQVQSFQDEALETCPNCGKRPRRLITLPAIVFKGSGWYKTDSRAPSATEKAEKAEAKTASTKSEKSEKGEGTGKGDAKTDAKPESKPAPKSEPKPSSTGSKGEAAS